MSDEAALLAAVRAHPDEDTPRLVYADWLQENDQPARAEFIRVQCEAARLPAGSAEEQDRSRRADALVGVHGPEWFGPLSGTFAYCALYRGFVTELTGHAALFQKHAASIARFAPVLHTARVWSVHGAAAKVLSLPFTEWVSRVSLDIVQPAAVAALRKLRPPPALTDLTLFTDSFRSADTFFRLADAPLLHATARLGLVLDLMPDTYPGHDEEIRLAGVQVARVLDRLSLPNLRAFGFWGVNDATAERMAGWPCLAQLDTLLFHCSAVDTSALAVLLGSPRLPPIVRAELDENLLGDVAAEAIARCARFAWLTHLDLGDNSITNRGANALLNSPHLGALAYLDLRDNDIGPRVWKRLAERFGTAFQEMVD